MSDLSVSVWKKFGKHRVYVNLPDRTEVASADLITGEIRVKIPAYRAEALKLLQPYLDAAQAPPRPAAPPRVPTPAQVTRPARPPKLPPLTPAEDLASNQPGAQIVGMLAGKGETPTRGVLARLRGKASTWETWQSGLLGERRVGRELERLRPHGWRVLHSVPTSGGGDIDHILIGPGGVFSINTKRCPGRLVWVGDSMVRIDHGPPRPYAAAATNEARKVQRVLERYCGFAVPVEPVLVFVDANGLDRASTQFTVRVYQEREVSALAPLTGNLTAAEVESVHTVARHRRIWLTL